MNGNWYAKEWGKIVLNQVKDGRDLTGRGDGWDITGVVSGKQVFLIFSSRGNIAYSAVTQPLPELRRKGGTLVSTLAAHNTCVLPTVISAEPSAVFR